MISGEEVKLYITYAPTTSCDAIARYIANVYSNKYFYIDEASYEVEVSRILERISINYNPELGHLIRYAKNTIALKLKDFVARKHRNDCEFDESTEGHVVDGVLDTVPYTIEEYPDYVILAVYNIINGKASKKDLDVISKVFKVAS